jgi:hypothetical protein
MTAFLHTLAARRSGAVAAGLFVGWVFTQIWGALS